MKKRITAFILVLILALGLMPQMAFAASIEDYGGNVNVMIRSQTPHEYLDVNRGGATIPLSGRIWSYITADGVVQGPAYCIKHGSGYPNGYLPVNASPYTANPTMPAAFASGYPLVSLASFTAAFSDVAGLTEDEYGYVTQLAIWGALGQLAVEGTTFTSGAETVIQPSAPEKLRVFNAVKHILASSGSGNASVTGLHIRAEETSLGDTVDLGSTTSLEAAANFGQYGIQKETISGTEYYTREYTVSSASAPDGGYIVMSLVGAPSGTILAMADGTPIQTFGVTFNVPVTAHSVSTDINSSGTEYSCRFKVCIPTSASEVGAAGSLSVSASASASSCTFYLVENGHAYEQDFIIADPSSTSASAAGFL